PPPCGETADSARRSPVTGRWPIPGDVPQRRPGWKSRSADVSLIDFVFAPVALLRQRLHVARLERRWRKLRAQGMHIGAGVNLPASTTIDESHCFLISIGDNCGFGDECHILAHDAQMDESLNAARLGRVIIHPSC